MSSSSTTSGLCKAVRISLVSRLSTGSFNSTECRTEKSIQIEILH